MTTRVERVEMNVSFILVLAGCFRSVVGTLNVEIDLVFDGDVVVLHTN